MPTYACTHGSIAPRCSMPSGFVPNEQTYQDTARLRVHALTANQITRAGPVLRPGTVYAVKYHDMFTWTRQSRTPAAYGPTADCTDTTQLQDWHYTCQPALPKTTKMGAGDNYMFVVGPINHAPSCMLIFFFNSCSTLDPPFRSCAPVDADGAVAQGIYLPAIYDRDTGTLFSETFEAPLNALCNTNELKWHIYGKAQSIGNGDCCTRLTMTRAKVTALLCSPDQAACLQTQLLAGIMQRFRQKDGAFVQWVAGHYSLPACGDVHSMKSLFTDESRQPPSANNSASCGSGNHVSSTYASHKPFTPCGGGAADTPCEEPEAFIDPPDCPVFFPHVSTSL